MANLTSGPLFLLLFLSAFFLTTTPNTILPDPFTLSPNLLKVTTFDHYWLLDFVCDAHVGPCKITYNFVPRGWSILGETLRVPIQNITSPLDFALQAKISVPTNEYSIEDIVIGFQGGSIQLRISHIYQSWVSNPIYSSHPFLTNSQNTLKTNNASEIKSQEYLAENKIIKSLPSSSYLQELINNNRDIDLIIEFQNILQFPTDQNKIGYLQRLIPLIQNQLIKITNQIQQDQIQQRDDSEKLSNLYTNRTFIQRQLSRMGDLQSMSQEVKQSKNEYTAKVIAFNRFESISRAYQSKMMSLIKSQNIDSNQLQRIQKAVLNDKEQVEHLKEEIKKMEIEKNYIERRIEANSRKIEDAERTGGNYDPLKLQQLENKVRQYSELVIVSKQDMEKLDSKIKKLQKSIIEISGLSERLTNINKQIQVYTRTQTVNSLNRINQLIETQKTLQKKLPLLQSQLRLSLNQIKAPSTPKQLIPLILPNNIQTQVFDRGQLSTQNFQLVSIYTTDWILQYGVPYLSRFSCSKTNSLVKKSSHIQKIKNGVIDVFDSENNFLLSLNLSVCSKIYAPSEKYLPKKGDSIVWEGEPKIGNQYNLFKAQVYPQNL